MKPEQASKVTMRMPTLLPFGEGRVSGEVIDMSTARSAGVVGSTTAAVGTNSRNNSSRFGVSGQLNKLIPVGPSLRQ